MRDRRKEIKKRIARRKRQKAAMGLARKQSEFDGFYDLDYGDLPYYSSDEYRERNAHPLWNKEVFAMKLLGAAALVLIVAILFKDPSPKLEPARAAITDIMEKEFQFAAVGEWYEKTFGKPLSLLPERPKDDIATDDANYAVPANGQILETFSPDSEGIILQTKSNEEVAAVLDGTVIFAGTKEDNGKMVIVQHADGSESWYGELSEIFVKVYDQVEAGQALGIVKSTGAETGEFYFALKKDERFIDPVQVIKFE